MLVYYRVTDDGVWQYADAEYYFLENDVNSTDAIELLASKDNEITELKRKYQKALDALKLVAGENLYNNFIKKEVE